ncbi:sensor histidine kinase [Nakamurella silvestris]|nr:sensor histidine kinase [Nakamurella silvestris]
MAGVGFVLQGQITDGLLDAKRTAAISEVDGARLRVAANLPGGADADRPGLANQFTVALDTLVNGTRSSSGAAQGSTAGVFEPVLISTRGGLVQPVEVGPADDVPADLRSRVAGGMIATQYTTVERDGVTVPALVVGAPVPASNEVYQLYLIYLLSGEARTVEVVQNTLLIGGAVLAILLAAIAGLVTQQVVRPVRRAAAVAGRLAAGSLDERMEVKGPDELAQLSRSFNGMAEAIKAQIRQLEEFGSLQRRFTSDVSHELRTPLTTVRMAADLLYEGRDDLPGYLGRSTELMVDELDRFEDLLADLLEISRYDAGMADLNAEPIDIRSSIASCVAATATIAVNAQVQVGVIQPDEPVVADIDNKRIERILRNLLANAIDHARGKAVIVELAADEHAVAITVTDEGVGLKPGEAGLVFNRFWRADASRQRQTGGTGLGLAISLEDAKLHGGWLQAWGRPGKGARFRLTLPRRKGELLQSSPLELEADGPVPADREEHIRYTDLSVRGSLPPMSGVTIELPAPEPGPSWDTASWDTTVSHTGQATPDTEDRP